MTRPLPPNTIGDVAQLEDLLSEPGDAALELMRDVEGDVIILGAGGKMGPTLARMVRRASDASGAIRKVIAVSRFGKGNARRSLEQHGVETISCDLLAEGALESLPEAANVIYMAGMKFGASGQSALTWAMNCHLPALVCRRYSDSRIAAFSTGNVYGPAPVDSGGSTESDMLQPVGEYATTCVGRERMLEYCSESQGTPVAILRLNYAVEMRYGVLVDLSQPAFPI